MTRLALLIGFWITGATLAHAQEGSIPQQVITNCTDTVTNYGKMPDCLKSGAVAYAILDYAQSDNGYADAATPVIDACKTNNETLGATWSCFKNTVANAVETRSLIGLDAMTDACYAAVSDPEKQTRLLQKHKELRAEIIGDTMVFGSIMYRSFKGCPD